MPHRDGPELRRYMSCSNLLVLRVILSLLVLRYDWDPEFFKVYAFSYLFLMRLLLFFNRLLSLCIKRVNLCINPAVRLAFDLSLGNVLTWWYMFFVVFKWCLADVAVGVICFRYSDLAFYWGRVWLAQFLVVEPKHFHMGLSLFEVFGYQCDLIVSGNRAKIRVKLRAKAMYIYGKVFFEWIIIYVAVFSLANSRQDVRRLRMLWLWTSWQSSCWLKLDNREAQVRYGVSFDLLVELKRSRPFETRHWQKVIPSYELGARVKPLYDLPFEDGYVCLWKGPATFELVNILWAHNCIVVSCLSLVAKAKPLKALSSWEHPCGPPRL